MFCDITNLDGTPFEGDPRQVLKRNLERARERGFTFYVAPEMEFFYFADGDGTVAADQPLDSGSYFDLTTADVASDLRKRTIHTLEAMGIPVEYSFHEDSPSQHEIDLRYTDALVMADNVMTFRLVVREIAMERGRVRHVHAQAARRRAGLGHAHPPVALRGRRQRLRRRQRPVPPVEGRPRRSSPACSTTPAEITAVTNQLVNSYKRLIPGTEAPAHVVLGPQQPLRPGPGAGDQVGQGRRRCRIEYRAPDPACNPYLAFSVILAAGLKGIDEGYELPDEATTNVFELTDAERAAEGMVELPQSLAEALDAMEGSELVAEALGEHIFGWFLRNKRNEWADYKAQVTPFELERYLPAW